MSGTPGIPGRLAEWEKVRRKIVDLQNDFNLFQAEFFNRGKFNRFANNLSNQVEGQAEICITGYFSETIRKEIEKIARTDRNVRLICPYFQIKSARDRKNLQVLKKLDEVGAKVRVNDRLHARFLVSYIPGSHIWRGILLIGSFDFNTECIGMERHDAGIKTSHPDLIESAVKLFEEIWSESSPLLEKYSVEIEKHRL